MRDAFRVNVRTLAEFYEESGDLIRSGDAMERMREGAAGHREVQSAYSEGWEKEVSLALEVEIGGLTLRLYGRADGVARAFSPPMIEEIKTTERAVSDIGADDMPVHWRQAELYGAMLCEREGFKEVLLRLTYLSLSGDKASFSRVFSRETLYEKLLRYAAPYVKWLSAVADRQALSRPTMRALRFPYDDYRDGQREMAANVYIALRDGRRLLCQAPTGIGKTMASLYPAIKALGEGAIERVFFLTARGTGQIAAGRALDRMRERGLIVRSVTLCAREKSCVQPDGICDPFVCPRARGYYTRRRAALYEALSMQDGSLEAVRLLSDRHTLCPFELSLDLCETADVVICDYNYVFDPRVRLQRFFVGKSDAGLLIDEAHNLPARARDMLSASLSQRAFHDLRVRIGKSVGRKHELYRAISMLLASFRETRASCGEREEIRREPPEAFVKAANEALPVLGRQLNRSEPWSGELNECFFALFDFLRCASGYDDDFRTLILPDGKAMVDVALQCVNPARRLARVLRRVHGAALFSATLSPMNFYRDLSGLSEQDGDALLSLPAPFPPENLLVLRMPLPVRYRQREQSMERLVRLIAAFVHAKIGNYIIFFPSYAYMRRAAELAEPMLRTDVRLLIQEREMKDDARQDFLNEFQVNPRRTLCAMAVLGGAFAEGVDLTDNRLSGAAVVGAGVPQVGAVNDALREAYEERFQQGYRYAYMYPGAARVMQAAGRVIRSERDRGAILLIDERWMEPDYARLLPEHWRLETVCQEKQLVDRLNAFFSDFR